MAERKEESGMNPFLETKNRGRETDWDKLMSSFGHVKWRGPVGRWL